MHRTLIVAFALLGVTTIVFAQSGNPIADRKALMKGNSSAAGTIARMLKGEAPYDKAAAEKALQQIRMSGEKGPSLYPAGSDKGDTRALPKIWENKADFDARFAELSKDAEAALTKTGSVEELKAVFGSVVQNCGGCHEQYRAPK